MMASPASNRSSPSPFRDRTPESTTSGLRRKDSKHALTTCHALTSNGKACRRPLAARDIASSSRYTIKGTMVVSRKGADPAVFFCWQHKDQADGWIHDKETEKVDIGESNELEAVFQKLGLEEIEEVEETIEKPQMTAPKNKRDDGRERKKPIAPRKVQRIICGCIPITEWEPAPRPSTRIHTQHRKSREKVSIPLEQRRSKPASPKNRRDSLSPGKMNVYQDNDRLKPPAWRNPASQPDVRRPLVERKPLASRTKSEPNRPQVKHWIPALPANSTDEMRLGYAKLLTAMTEPPTRSDDEGYIYMFWQSDIQQTADETDAAASIVGGPTYSLQDSEKVLQKRFFRSQSASGPQAEKTIFLKIGRAGNVHQRMIQWQNQCGYSISLLRYYPMKEAIKLPCVGKVERMIHLHLDMLSKRVPRKCRCGTSHREWFEVEGTTSAIREIDSIIMQWVTWALDKYR